MPTCLVLKTRLSRGKLVSLNIYGNWSHNVGGVDLDNLIPAYYFEKWDHWVPYGITRRKQKATLRKAEIAEAKRKKEEYLASKARLKAKTKELRNKALASIGDGRVSLAQGGELSLVPDTKQ